MRCTTEGFRRGKFHIQQNISPETGEIFIANEINSIRGEKSGIETASARFHVSSPEEIDPRDESLIYHRLSSIKEFVNDVIDPYVKYLEKERICESHISNFTDSFIKILSAYIEQHLIDVQQHLYALNYMFAYCFIWAFVHPIHLK